MGMLSDIQDGIKDFFHDFLQEITESAVSSALSSVDNAVMRTGQEVGQTPSSWNQSVFSMIEGLSTNVILPIATSIFTILIVADFIKTLCDKNNFKEIDVHYSIMFVVKSAIGVLMLSKTMTLVMGFFDVGSYIARQAVEYIESQSLAESFLNNLKLESLDLGDLALIGLLAVIMNLLSMAITVCIYIILYGRMIEIYLHISVAPIPMSTIINQDFGETGKNYLRLIFSLALQGFLIIGCVAIYYALILASTNDAPTFQPENIFTGQEAYVTYVREYFIKVIALGLVLCFTLFKTATISKSIMNAH